MPDAISARGPRAVLAIIDPRRSVMAAIVWLVVGLAGTFAVAASIWVGSLAREIVLQQHARRLALEADQVGADISQAIASRVGALRVAEAMLPAAAPAPASATRGLAAVFDQLTAAYPDLDWLAVADAGGAVITSKGDPATGADVRDSEWFRRGRGGLWLGVINESPRDTSVLAGSAPALGDFSAPIRDAAGVVVGVIAARLSWRWAPNHLQRLSEAVGPPGSAQAVLLRTDGTVLAGPAEWRGRPWPGRPLHPATDGNATGARSMPRFERLEDGALVLVARAPITTRQAEGGGDYEVQLSEPNARVYERADHLTRQILWVSVFLGAVTVVLGALGAHRLTRRLRRLTLSVATVGEASKARIDVPPGRDEITQLGSAFATLLSDLEEERAELRALSDDLERRVLQRTREVQRLAEESRYSAVVRERLRIARDLHDTLAHSMMALLSEIRLLSRLQIHDPAALAGELVRAEQVARDGLEEARRAIAQMRVNPVRDTGLGAALGRALTAFSNHSGVTVDYRTDPVAAGVGDERAETVFTMVGEALRNIERHAGATRVTVSLLEAGAGYCELRISDDGVGFDADRAYPGHFGLIGLREQAQLIGAEIRIDSVVDYGTTLIVRWQATLPPL